MYRAHWWLLVLSFALFASVFSIDPSIASASSENQSSTTATIRLPGHVLPALAKATIVPSSTKSDSDPITLTLVLKHDDQVGFDRFLHDLYEPKSPRFHHFLTQRQIADRFGPSRADYDSVRSYFRASGFRLLKGSVNRLTLEVRGTRGAAERALMTSISDYRIDGRTFHANTNDPALPAQLATHVQAIAGLSNLQKPHHALVGAAITCGAALLTTPACYLTAPGQQAFDFSACVTAIASKNTYTFANGCTVTPGVVRPLSSPSVPWTQLDGTGQTIGLLEFDTFAQSDVVNFLALAGQPSSLISQLSVVPVNGGVASPGPDQT